MKFHLKRVVGMQKLTFEELMTILCQIESCLNSRPLTNLASHSDNEIDVITPGHFLVGRLLHLLPSRDTSTEKTYSSQKVVTLSGISSTLVAQMVK